MKKFKEVRIQINSSFYNWGPGATREMLQKFDKETRKFFASLGWEAKKATSYDFCVVASEKLKNPNYDDSCYIYCHPLEIVGIIPCEEEETFKEYVENNWNAKLQEFGEIFEITSIDVYKDITKEEQVDYLKSIEPELISIIESYKKSDGCLMHILLEKRLYDGGCFSYCRCDADYVYLESLIERTRKIS